LATIGARFVELIGTVIKTCGLLEFQINHVIKSFSKDPVLAKHILKLSLRRRIDVLRDLMLDRPELTASEVKSLCKEFEKIAEDRNVIAHSPVVIGAPPQPPIIISRDPFKPKEFMAADLEAFVKRTRHALGKLHGWIRKIVDR
jgi:hypothetical protein